METTTKVQIPSVLSSQIPELHEGHETTAEEESLGNSLFIQLLA
jgi:hypothetical protein